MLILQRVFDTVIHARARRRRVSFRKTRRVGNALAFLRREAREESGISLLEVVIAMAILNLAVVGLVGGLSFVISVSDTLEEQAVTETLAARYVEEHLNGGCPSEDSPIGSYQVEGHTVEGNYVVRASLEGEEPFVLSSLAAESVDCQESEGE